MPIKIPAKYVCTICKRDWRTYKDAELCEKSHNHIVSIEDSCFDDPERFKYPNRIDCKAKDGTIISYYRDANI